MTVIDRRLHVEPKHQHAEVTPARVAVGAVPLRPEPRADVSIDTELLFGEVVSVFSDQREGWALVQSQADGYVGWCGSAALTSVAGDATHEVTSLRTHVYPGPSIKLPAGDVLSINARVTAVGTEGAFTMLDTGGFVFTRHLGSFDRERPHDWVSVAERFIGTPYLWGGRTSVGLDCSGLVQMAMTAAGIPCPRDSDMQEGRTDASAPGAIIPIPDDLETLARGDLLFWPGHVAICAGRNQLLHATAHFMDTMIEPLIPAVERITSAGLELRAVRRLSKSDGSVQDG